MAADYYEVYRMLSKEELKEYRYRAYRQMQESRLKVSVDLYSMIHRAEMTDVMTVKQIRQELENDDPPAFADAPLAIGDVIAVTKSGITAAYYVDPTKLILLPDFFHQPASGALIMIDTDNFPLDGRKGSWMTVDTLRLDGRNLFLMQSRDYGRDAPCVIVDEQGKELAADKAGFTEEVIEQIRKSLKELDAQLAAESTIALDKKPKLEVWQQYFENGEYLRAAEISEEQNYNMIDGTANNRAPKRSVLERLQEKQSEVKIVPSPTRVSELMQETEIERSRK